MGKNAPALSNTNAGELSPDFAGRVDNEKYPIGSSTLQNFIPRVQGPSRRRPGTRWVQPVKNSANRVWLRKFIFSQGTAYQIEFGPGYCRFYTNHGQLQVSGVTAWSNATAYTIGALVSLSGVNYYCIVANTNQSPPNSIYWYPLTGTTYEIPTPFTAPMLTNADGTCGLTLQQSGDVVYIACGSYWPQTLTLTSGATVTWVLAAYNPSDGPFLDQNQAANVALYVQPVAGSNTQYTVFATQPVFAPSDVAGSVTNFPGRLVRIDTQYFNTMPWTQNIPNEISGVHAIGDLVRFGENTYQALNAGTSGGTPPTHTYGVVWDGPSVQTPVGVQWLYVDSGYGIGYVTAYTSAMQVTVTVSPYAGTSNTVSPSQTYKFPAATVGSVWAISSITQANPAVVTTTATHNVTVGDPVFLTGVGGMTQISEQSYVATAVTTTTITLGTVNSTNFSAYTSGGSAIRNASVRWQLGAWGYGAAGYTASFPTCNAFYADRLFWAGGIMWWGSVPGFYSSHAEDAYGVVTAACAVSGVVAAEDVDSITWMSPLLVLLIGTKGGEFGLAPIVTTQPLGPDNNQVTRFSKLRSRGVPPQIINTSNFYVQLGGKKVLAQDYNFWLQIYESTNQMRLANHIAGYTVSQGIIDSAWHQEPYETYWGARSDGLLIGYTFDRQDNVTGWHEQPVGGSVAGAAVVECVSVIPAPDGTRDETWMIVRRTIGGATVRSVEYMEKDYETGDAQNTMCYLDASAQYSGIATTTITGLSYLNGETVGVLLNGGDHPDCVVSGGKITLNYPGTVVQVGLKCPYNMVTMDIEGGADVGTAQGKMKRCSHVVVRLKNTLGAAGYVGLYKGPSPTLMLPNQSTTHLASPPPLFTGDTDAIPFPGDNSRNCKIQVSGTDGGCIEVQAIFPIITVSEPSPP